MEYSNYLDEVRSPYKVPSAAAYVHGVARQPVGLTSSPALGAAGPAARQMAAAQSRHVQLEPPREEDEDEEQEEDSSSTE